MNRFDPIGALDWIPPTDGSGNWTAEKGDSPGSLARDAHITQAQAEAAVKSANHDRGQARTSETMVYSGDVVNVASRPGYTRSSGSSTTNSSTSTPSATANTAAIHGNPVQTVSNINNYVGIAISTAEQIVQNTQVGGNFAYAISGNSKIVNMVGNTFKYTPYVGLGVAVLTGSYLSTENNPVTGNPYQSWAETGTDVGINISTIIIGTKCGEWYGAGAASFYIGVKTNVQYQIRNGLNPGMIFLMNKE